MNKSEKELKKELILKLSQSLPVLRAKLNLSQEDLAFKIGITRQTISAFESKQRQMTWSIFLALILLFYRNKDTKQLLLVLGIYTKDLDEFLLIKK